MASPELVLALTIAGDLCFNPLKVNEYKRKDQFVTHCFMPDFHNIDQVESFRQMQYPAINVYHDVQDKQDGQRIAYAGDFVRTVADNNYIGMRMPSPYSRKKESSTRKSLLLFGRIFSRKEERNIR